jgi:uncharacterized protein YjbJ (UPF0337 family)
MVSSSDTISGVGNHRKGSAKVRVGNVTKEEKLPAESAAAEAKEKGEKTVGDVTAAVKNMADKNLLVR